MRQPFYFILSFLFLSSTFSLSAQKTLDKTFNKIYVSGKIELVLQRADVESINVPHDGEKILYEVSEGILRIKRTEMWKYKNYKKTIKVVVNYQRLNTIKAGAGAKVESEEVLGGDVLELNFSSGAFAKLDIKVADLDVNVGEGSNLDLTGSTESLRVKASTGGILNASDLNSLQAYIKANTGGIANIRAVETLEASANTGGIINYRGNPDMVKVKENLGGSVHGG